MAPTFEQVFPVLYQGWDRTAAQADFNAGGWKNKAGVEQFLGGQVNQDPGQRAEETTAQAFARLQAEANKRFGEYQANNPWNFDKVLEAKTGEAKEQIDPYYNETLSDYLTGVNRKISRSTQDTQDLLTELGATTRSYTEATKLRLNEALGQAREGMADVGLFDSGARFRKEGLLGVEGQRTLEDYGRGQDLRAKGLTTDLSRTLEDTDLARKMTVRDTERARATDIGVQAGQLAKEAGQSYVSGFQQTLPPELQSNTSFDLLKQIGIYG